MKRILLFLSLAHLFFIANAQEHHSITSQKHTTLFIENNGQWPDAAKFKTDIPNGAMFITDSGFVYNFASRKDLDNIHDLYESNKGTNMDQEMMHYHSYKINFEGCNTQVPVYIKNQKSKTYFNYFIGNDQKKWAGNVGLYGNIVRKDIYNGIDLSISSLDQSVKYDFLVAVGAEPSQIVLSFEGVIPAIQQNGDLKIRTSVNEVIEKAPYTYQEINGKKIVVATKYILRDEKLGFEFPNGYNKAYPLIIDPELVFATYSGSSVGINFGFATTFDDGGNVYAGAQAYAVGWPATIGAFQSGFAGGTDVAINKYSSDGTGLIYSTYYGGTNMDIPHAMMVNAQNELVVVGSTTSPDLPVTPGCYDNTYNNPGSIFIAHFNSSGSALMGATYIGAPNSSIPDPTAFLFTGTSTPLFTNNVTSPLELDIDTMGNFWVIGNSGSSNFPITANALQPTSGGGIDVVLFKMNPTCSSLLYSTYLGGSGNDAGYGIKFQSNGNIAICGMTKSANFPTTSGVLHPAALGGPLQGFVAIVDPSGILLSSTYLGTPSGTDQAVNLGVDCADNIYVLGRTEGNYPISANVFSMPNTDLFIDKLTPDLSASLLSTRLGYPNISSAPNTYGGGTPTQCFPTGFTLSTCGNIYLSTFSSSGFNFTFNMPLTPDAFSTVPDHFYFAALGANFSTLKFGTYLGVPDADDHSHAGVNRMDKNGTVYQSICTNLNGWSSSPNVYAPYKLNGTYRDMVSLKFALGLDGTNLNLTPHSTGGVNDTAAHCIRGCKSASITFERVGSLDSALTIHYLISGDAINGTDYQHIADSIVIPQNQTSADLQIKPLLAPVATGVRIVDIQALSSCGCGIVVGEAKIKIYDSLFAEIITPPDTVCPNTPITIVANIDSSLDFHWQPQAFDQGSLEIHPIPSESTTYMITATQPGAPATCPARVVKYSVNMEQTPLLSFDKKEVTICLNPGDSLDINGYIQPEGINYDYNWSPSTYLRNDHDLNNKFYAPVGDYYEVLSAFTPVAHCSNKDSILIHVVPAFSFTGISPSHDTTIRYGDSIQLDVEGDAIIWNWSPVIFPEDPTIKNPLVRPLKTTMFTVVGYGRYGCSDTAHVLVKVGYSPDFLIPNAFSPNGDGLNDVFKIENLQFEKLTSFKIFNRYGQCVYDGIDPDKGWDGTFNNKPCDLDTYYYFISLTTPDAIQKSYKGSVILLR